MIFPSYLGEAHCVQTLPIGGNLWNNVSKGFLIGLDYLPDIWHQHFHYLREAAKKTFFSFWPGH